MVVSHTNKEQYLIKSELVQSTCQYQTFAVTCAGMTGTTYLRRLADDIKSTLLQGLAEQKQELHTLNTKLAEQCDLGSTSNESTLNMQLAQILNNSESFSVFVYPSLTILQIILKDDGRKKKEERKQERERKKES